MPLVAVLFAKQASIYKLAHRCDVFDIDRSARSYEGTLQVIAQDCSLVMNLLKNVLT